MKFTFDTNISKYECEIIYLTTSDINTSATLYNFDKKIANTKLIAVNNKLQLLVGVGDNRINIKLYEKIINAITTSLNNNNIKSAILPILKVESFNEDKFISFATKTIQSNNYQIKKIGSKIDDKKSLQTVAFNTTENLPALTKGINIAKGINLCKDLADMPSNICTPTYLSEVSQNMAKELGLECEILEESDMEALKMYSLLSVGKGSIQPSKLITLSYKGNGKEKPVVLVGKGVTFDSGGISLKAGGSMDEMKYDMAGAASVLGAMRSIAGMKAKVNLTIIIPAVENMPAHNASKPGDVVKSMSGQTIEILNTDAEGRLILCDALTYAKKFNPKVVIDVATLTGAVIVALGRVNSGLMANNQELADNLIKAGLDSNDTLWQLPLPDEDDESLQSNFADMANIGNNREAGSIIAGHFLAKFAKEYSWAHLDIAGAAWNSGKNKGATGRPVSLFCEYLLS